MPAWLELGFKVTTSLGTLITVCGIVYTHVASKADLARLEVASKTDLARLEVASKTDLARLEASSARIEAKVDRDLEAHSIVLSEHGVWTKVNEKLLDAQLKRK